MPLPDQSPPPVAGSRRIAFPTRRHIDLWGPAGLALLVFVGLAIRLALVPVEAFVYDRRAFTEWMVALQLHPFSDFYRLPLHIPADHLPGTLWLLAGLGKVAGWIDLAGDGGIPRLTPQQAQPLLKALPIFADLIVGILVFAIVRRVAPEHRRAALLAAGGWLLAPGIIFISAVWGQWDVVSLVFVLAAILCALHGRWSAIAVPPLLALAMLMKPQFAVLAPLLGLFILINAGVPVAQRHLPRSLAEGSALVRSLWRGAGIMLLAGCVLAVGIVTLAGWPFRVGLLPIDGWMTYAERASFAANRFQGTTYGAVSLWIIPLGVRHAPHDSNAIWGPFSAAMIGWGLVIVSAIAGLVIAHRDRWNAIGLITGSTVTYLGFVLFATRMHERYLLPALAFTVLLAGVRPALGTIMPAIALSLAYFASVYLSYASYTFVGWVPLRNWRTGPLLSTLGVIGVASFAVILITAWFATAHSRTSLRPHPLPAPTVDATVGRHPINAGG